MDDLTFKNLLREWHDAHKSDQNTTTRKKSAPKKAEQPKTGVLGDAFAQKLIDLVGPETIKAWMNDADYLIAQRKQGKVPMYPVDTYPGSLHPKES